MKAMDWCCVWNRDLKASPLCLFDLRSQKVHVRIMIHGFLVSMPEFRRLLRRVLVKAYEWLKPARTHTAPMSCPGIRCQPLCLGSLHLSPLASRGTLGRSPFSASSLRIDGTSSFFLILSLTSFTMASSPSVSYSSFLSFSWRRNLVRLFFAFSARPGSLVYQNALRAFSRSSLSVSLIMARVSLEKIIMYQVRS